MRRFPRRRTRGSYSNLNALLQAVIKEDVDEIRLRLVFLAKRWGIRVDLDDYGNVERRSLSF